MTIRYTHAEFLRAIAHAGGESTLDGLLRWSMDHLTPDDRQDVVTHIEAQRAAFYAERATLLPTPKRKQKR